ncbi:MAG: hypothetical protein ACTIOG_16820 [Pseudomonas helleri]|uniref:hypothetical protein n=1 Tax=Pseudomonas helleri TaxID=1608996 RepID=UPI003F9A6789
MGNQITLSDVVFTDTSLPILRDDPLLSSGSLILVDVGHSKGRLSSVPGNGALISNIAGSIASEIVGAGSVSPEIFTNFATNAMLTELSAKGGLHVIKSKVNDVNNTRYTLRIPAAIRAYLLANPTHSYYFSIWQQVTRSFDDASAPIVVLAESAYSNDFLINIGTNGSPLGASTNLLGKATNLDPTAGTGSAKHQLAVSKATGTLVNMAYTDLFIFGGCPSAGVMNSALHKGGSQVMYRVYLEDLTVSGRTYAEVKAQDDALYASAFAVGGKFYGDTYTAPSILP